MQIRHTLWVFSVADSATSNGERINSQHKQWSKGNAANCLHEGWRFDSWLADLSALPNLTLVQILPRTNFWDPTPPSFLGVIRVAYPNA